MWFVSYGLDRNVVMYSQSVGGTVWNSSEFQPVLVGADEGEFDFVSSLYPAVVVNRDTIESNLYLTSSIKIYD